MSKGIEETTIHIATRHTPGDVDVIADPARKFNHPVMPAEGRAEFALQARRVLLAACEAFTAVLVTAWKLASATSAACFEALLTLS